MPRYVILEHDHPYLHWDLMLEADDVLQTWRLDMPPREAGCAIDATELADHRQAYLDYEGPVSGDRGMVRRWDAGVFEEEAESVPNLRRLFLHGTRINIRIVLERVGGASWRLTA